MIKSICRVGRVFITAAVMSFVLGSLPGFAALPADYKEFKERHPKKLFIFISHAEGSHPAGRSARKVEYDADVKIMVSCFKAWCKSRFMERPGEPYVIWEEGAAKTLKDDNMEDYLNDGMGE